MSSQGSKLPEKKKNDLLKKFLNAQQYTKKLKKNASDLIDDNHHTVYSYDQIPTYLQVPQSAKLPSTKHFSKQLTFTIDNSKVIESRDFTSKPKAKKTQGFNSIAFSSNDITNVKNRKSSYSNVGKSDGCNKSIKGDIDVFRNKDYDVHSVTREKYNSEVMHDSLGEIKKQSFSKVKNKLSLNHQSIQKFESGELSDSFENKIKHLKPTETKISNKIYNDTRIDRNQYQPDRIQESPYDLTAQNFIKLINKVQQLESVIQLYQEAISQMRKKIIDLEEANKQSAIYQIYIDSLKDQILLEKVIIDQKQNKSAELSQKLSNQQKQLKQYEAVMFESIEKVAKHYQQQISKMTGLEKENNFLKFLLRLDSEMPDPEIPQQNLINKQDMNENDDLIQNPRLTLSKNMGQFRQKIVKKIEENKMKLFQ